VTGRYAVVIGVDFLAAKSVFQFEDQQPTPRLGFVGLPTIVVNSPVTRADAKMTAKPNRTTHIDVF
jgi:hypothetical protein